MFISIDSFQCRSVVHADFAAPLWILFCHVQAESETYSKFLVNRLREVSFHVLCYLFPVLIPRGLIAKISEMSYFGSCVF